MQNENTTKKRVSKKVTDKVMRIAVVVLTVLLLTVLASKAISSYIAEKNYQKFITSEIFTDNNGVNILGTYVPTGDGLIHTIVKEENNSTDKDYVLYAVFSNDNTKYPVMRITEKQSQYLNRYLCKSTTLDLSGVNTLPIQEEKTETAEELKGE